METSALNSEENFLNCNSDEFEDAADFQEIELKSNFFGRDSCETVRLFLLLYPSIILVF